MGKKRTAEQASRGPAQINNRRARYDYEILDSVEAGVVLAGSEVKSVFAGRASLTDAYCEVLEGEMWLMACDIEPYAFTSAWPPERRRDRKLLLHRREIDLIGRRAQEKGLTLVPLRIYFKNGRAKVEVALARGKRQYDKRRAIGERETRREIDRALRERE
jgi:SsrA-binding protein